MQILVLDFETYFSSTYSLKKMTQEEYIRHSEFSTHCMGIGYLYTNFNIKHLKVLRREEIEEFVEKQNWAKTIVICHHAAFDLFILSHHYKRRPYFIIDTYSIAHGLFGPLTSASLEALAKRFDLESKTVPYKDVEGILWEHMPETIKDKLLQGCLQDVTLTAKIAKQLLKVFPKSELRIIDLTIRMFTEPEIIGDVRLFEEVAFEEHQRKNETLIELNVTETMLQSAATVVRLLEANGETVVTKAGKNGPIPAIAKTDPYMQELLSRNDYVGRLACARLDVRSTLTERRGSRLAAISKRGAIPVYLYYAGALTKRWSGGDAINPQNLPRKGVLRKGLTAPENKIFVIIDFSQIEYRVLCGLAKQKDKLEILRDPKRDLYCEFGTKLFRRLITKDDAAERLLSKIIVLGCGYGTGKAKAFATVRSHGFDFSSEVTDNAVDLYRTEHSFVVQLWERCNRALHYLATGKSLSVDGLPIKFSGTSIIWPNGLSTELDLKWCAEERGWFRRTSYRPDKTICNLDSFSAEFLLKEGYTRYWGGGLTEMLCQSLARIKLSDLIYKAYKELRLRPCLLVHDEYVCLVDKDMANEVKLWLVKWASEPASWWTDSPPFAAEGYVSKTYCKL